MIATKDRHRQHLFYDDDQRSGPQSGWAPTVKTSDHIPTTPDFSHVGEQCIDVPYVGGSRLRLDIYGIGRKRLMIDSGLPRAVVNPQIRFKTPSPWLWCRCDVGR